jgi:hypothetical protein
LFLSAKVEQKGGIFYAPKGDYKLFWKVSTENQVVAVWDYKLFSIAVVVVACLRHAA